MQKGALKQVPKRKIHRCTPEVQALKDSIKGTVKADYLTVTMKEIRQLPILNKKPILRRNRKGVLIEIIGTRGDSSVYPADYCRGVWYFDGNRLGKRKREHAKAMFLEDNNFSLSKSEENLRIKVWRKMEQSNCL